MGTYSYSGLGENVVIVGWMGTYSYSGLDGNV